MYIAIYDTVRLLLPRRTIITAFGKDCKEKRVCGYDPPQCLVFFIGTTRCYRTGPAGWTCPHISNCYHGELSPYLLNAPVVNLSLAVLLIFIETEPAEDFREFTQTCRIVNTRRFLVSLSGEFLPAFVS